MTTYNYSRPVNSIPLVKQLKAIWDSIPDEDLLSSLKAPTGRLGYTVEVLWKTYSAMQGLCLDNNKRKEVLLTTT